MKSALTKEQARRRVQRQTKLLREFIDDVRSFEKMAELASLDTEALRLVHFRRVLKANEALSELSNLAWRCVS